MENNVLKLITYTNTPYIWNYWPGKLDALFMGLPDDTVVDVTRCRFDPQCVNVINKHNGRLMFINSTEPELNDILVHNYYVSKNAGVEKKVSELPYSIIKNKLELTDIFDTVKSSSSDVIWRMPNLIPSDFIVSATAIFSTLLMNFVKRKFDTSPAGISMTTLVTYFKGKMRDVDYTYCDRFYWLRGADGFAILDFHGKSTIHFAGYGNITKDGLRNLNVIPYWVGNESPRNDDRHKRIADVILNDIKYEEEIQYIRQPTMMTHVIRKYGS